MTMMRHSGGAVKHKGTTEPGTQERQARQRLGLVARINAVQVVRVGQVLPPGVVGFSKTMHTSCRPGMKQER